MAKRFKKEIPEYFDYKDAKTLQKFVNIYGQIEPASKTGLSAKQQRQLATAIKRARHLALVAFVNNAYVEFESFSRFFIRARNSCEF